MAARASAPPPASSRARRPSLPFILGLLLAAGLFAALAWPFAPHTVDDAWITFRYSRQWALGNGPYFNPGEHVEGYSNLLLMLLMTPVIAWAGPDAALPVAKAIGLGAALLSVLGAGVLARRAAGEAAWADATGVVAAGLVAMVPGFAYHASSGLETTLYACLLLWGVIGLSSASDHARWPGAVALALAAISRPEAPAMFALAWLIAGVAMLLRRDDAGPERDRAALFRRWRPLLIVGFVGTVAIAGQIVFRQVAYDGEWVANTYFAKIGGSGDRFRYVTGTLQGLFLGPIGLVAGWLGAFAAGRPPLAWWMAALLGAFGAFLPLATGGDWMRGSRLVMPYVPLLAVATAFGWGRLAGLVLRRAAVVNVLLLLTLPVTLRSLWYAHGELVRHAAVETAGARSGHGALAAWLRARAQPGDTVVLMDIGEIGYRCIEQRILDITGLTDRHIAKSPGQFIAKEFDLAYVFDRRPEFIVLTFIGRGEPLAPVDANAPLHPFSEMESRLVSHPAFARDYFRAAEPGAVAVAGLEGVRRFFGADAVFPYATPGQRYVLVVYRRKT